MSLDLQCAQVMMQVNDVVISFSTQHVCHFVHGLIDRDHPVDIRIASEYYGKFALGQKVNLRIQLLLDTPHHGRGQDDIADRAKPDDQNLWWHAVHNTPGTPHLQTGATCKPGCIVPFRIFAAWDGSPH